MEGLFNVDDRSRFSANFHGWFSTNSLQVIKSLKPDENGSALVVETFSGGTDLRKVYNADFPKEGEVRVRFKIKVFPGTEISGMSLSAMGSPPGNFVLLPVPPADGEWHKIVATFVPGADDLNELWINIKEANQERHRKYIDNIVVTY